MKTFAPLLLALLAVPVLAQDRPAGAKADPRVELAAKIPGAKAEDLRPTPVAGIYELTHGGDISYVSGDGKFIFSGDMYRVSTTGDFPNLSTFITANLAKSRAYGIESSLRLRPQGRCSGSGRFGAGWSYGAQLHAAFTGR